MAENKINDQALDNVAGGIGEVKIDNKAAGSYGDTTSGNNTVTEANQKITIDSHDDNSTNTNNSNHSINTNTKVDSKVDAW